MNSVLFSPSNMYILFVFVARLLGKHSIVRNSCQLQFNTNIQFIKIPISNTYSNLFAFIHYDKVSPRERLSRASLFFSATQRECFSTRDSFQCISKSGLWIFSYSEVTEGSL